MPGYCVAGTVGAKVLAGKKQITTDKNVVINVKLAVEHLSFSAHADAKGIMQLIRQSAASSVVLVHGEKNEMRRLRSELVGRNRARVTKGDLAVHMPSNTQLVSLHFREEKVAKVIRSAVRVRARQLPHTAQPNARTCVRARRLQTATGSGALSRSITGVLVSQNFTHRVVEPS